MKDETKSSGMQTPGKSERIGITGGIGSGKSVVSRIVRCNGFPVYDCDFEAGRLMQSDSALKERLSAVLGGKAYNACGELDRKYVASRIFGDSELRKDVNRLVHSAVREDFRRFAEARKGKVFVESAILFSSGLASLCDKVWVVEAPKETRVVRVMSRNGCDRDDVESRMSAQSTEFAKVPSDALFLDNGGEVPLLQKILRLLYE